jgi:nucleotide-binding universal stress UspA family protein
VDGVHPNPFDNYTDATPEVWAAMAEAAEKETKERFQRLNEQLKSVGHEVVIGAGNIREVISKLIKQKEIDLIVLGRRGVGKGVTWLSR